MKNKLKKAKTQIYPIGIREISNLGRITQSGVDSIRNIIYFGLILLLSIWFPIRIIIGLFLGYSIGLFIVSMLRYIKWKKNFKKKFQK